MSNSIYRLDVSTGETERIIRSASSWEGFTIHPHRAEIVFAEEKGSGRTHTSELYALDLESQAVVQLTDPPALLETAPLWSPDGEQLAFLFRGMDNIGVMDKNGDVRILEVPTKGGVHSFTWSPDGEWILFWGVMTNRVYTSYRVMAQVHDGLSGRVLFPMYHGHQMV
ncbi:MAG: hypothetical protein M5R40_10480 [Anaerolineae bacterium]|nr:hypothetical protein [Anaerolineae bacterium]